MKNDSNRVKYFPEDKKNKQTLNELKYFHEGVQRGYTGDIQTAILDYLRFQGSVSLRDLAMELMFQGDVPESETIAKAKEMLQQGILMNNNGLLKINHNNSSSQATNYNAF